MDKKIIEMFKNDKYNSLIGDRFMYEIIPIINKYNVKQQWLDWCNKDNYYVEELLNKSWDNVLYTDKNNEYRMNDLDFNIIFKIFDEHTDIKLNPNIIKNNILDFYYNICHIDNINHIGYIYDDNYKIYKLYKNKTNLITGLINILQNNIDKIINVIQFVNNKINLDIILYYRDELLKYVKNFVKNIYNDIIIKYNNIIIIENMNNINKDILPIYKNKIIDLKTMEISERSNNHYFDYEIKNKYINTYNTPEFIRNIFDNNEQIILFVQKSIGYWLTGELRETCFFIFHGIGSNGKTTLLNFLKKILGNLYISINNNIFKKDLSVIFNELSLQRGRLCVMDESEEGDEINERKIKLLSDKSNSKIVIGTNYNPKINTNFSVTRRLIYVPFDIIFVDNPIKINERKKILDYNIDLDELFTWCLNGSKKYYNEGLYSPIMDDLKKILLNDIDTVTLYFNFRIKIDTESFIQASILYNDYKKWCKNHLLKIPLSSNKFGILLKERGYTSTKTKKFNIYQNIKFNEDI
ncbi:phage/plasmid primase, P4 family [Choristoneura biennis entomopoxvirus]|uniref:Phage/plasmid primase, P4 family n=1 Tax=Choristoneura biennis entomopoxvirus TaxID=10288 RepID=A0A916KPA2_CBEPV|nr:DNA primase [Choristoneura biennis entomopoxvirus]YP_008004402.1 DNA primase [Choristoneura biennis entomopoxvirus]CCU55571.1 phage/plasmid primase, P4 family [Choristoneura biennis entomopoxvirus]CCU55900.1 phage/plasmid primase, P4 family [Choristoneura biennis entomopoxvirus]